LARFGKAAPILACAIASCALLDRSRDLDDIEKALPETRSDQPDVLQPECVPIPPRQDSWFNKAVGYEVFVRSFRDSDGDGIGDLAGLIEKLDYLNDGDAATTDDLGIDLVWLMPVSPSPSYHGYDVTDYRGVNPDYGTMQQLKTLQDEAHERGVRVILDLVLNHASVEHPWFAQSAAGEAGKRDWFVWSSEKLDWPRPWGDKAATWHQHKDEWYYGIFWSGMPDLNFKTPQVRAEMKDVALFWLKEVGADGFRLDAVRYIVETGPDGMQDTAETFDWWREFAQEIKAAHPDALLVGEAWTSNATTSLYHAGGKGMDLTFDFDLMESIVAGVQAEDATDVEKTLCSFAGIFPAGAGDATFLSNHDLLRLATRLKEDDTLVRLSAMLLFTLPGTPFVYYGEELGMRNGATLDDKHKRLPMRWDGSESGGFTSGKPWAKSKSAPGIDVASQDADPNSLLSLYRTLIRLRQENVALSLGGFQPVKCGSRTASNLWAFARSHDAQSAVVVVNLSGTSALEAWAEPPAASVTDYALRFPTSAPASVSNARVSAGDVAPYSVAVLVAP